MAEGLLDFVVYLAIRMMVSLINLLTIFMFSVMDLQKLAPISSEQLTNLRSWLLHTRPYAATFGICVKGESGRRRLSRLYRLFRFVFF